MYNRSSINDQMNGWISEFNIDIRVVVEAGTYETKSETGVAETKTETEAI